MKLLSVSEVAERIGLHPDTIRKRIRDGSFPAINYGKGSRPTYRIDETMLNEYENARLTQKADPTRGK